MMKKILSVLFLFGFLFVSFSFASDDRKYASTRMFGCEENDIVLGNKVRASCNAYQNLEDSAYYQGMNSNAVDINGWKYSKLYLDRYSSCPAGYEIPLLSDFTSSIKSLSDVQKIKLPAGGIYLQYGFDSKKFWHIDIHGYYLVKDWKLIINRTGEPDRQYFYFNLNDGKVGKTTKSTIEAGEIKVSLRCMRIAPATSEEKLGDLTIVQDERLLPNYGLSTSEDFSITNNQNISTLPSSQDEYVNGKLSEINDCFLDTYSGHLANLNDTIKMLTTSKNTTTDKVMKEKYEIAIRKLTEIKKIFLQKYGFLFGDVYTNGGASQNPVVVARKSITTGGIVIDPSLDKKEYSYRVVFNAKNIDHIYALLLIVNDLYQRGYDVNSIYNAVNKTFVRQTGKTFAQHAIMIKTKLKNKITSTKLQSIKEALELGDTNNLLDGMEFQFGDNVGNEKIGYGDMMGDGASSIMDSMNQFLDELNKSRNGFGNKKSGGYNDTYGGGGNGFNDPRGQNMAGGFDEVVGYSTTVKESHNGAYKGSHFQYRSVNGSDGSFRQGSKRSLTDENGNVTVYERVVVNNTDGTTEVYEGTNNNGNRQGNYTKTDKDGEKVAEKQVGGSAPTSSDGGTPTEDDTPESSGSPTGSINPEEDNGTMAPGVFIGLLNLLGKSAFVNSFNGGNGATNPGNGDVNNTQEQGGAANTYKISGGGAIDRGQDACEICHDTIGGINPGAYKAGQYTNRGGR